MSGSDDCGCPGSGISRGGKVFWLCPYNTAQQTRKWVNVVSGTFETCPDSIVSGLAGTLHYSFPDAQNVMPAQPPNPAGYTRGELVYNTGVGGTAFYLYTGPNQWQRIEIDGPVSVPPPWNEDLPAFHARGIHLNNRGEILTGSTLWRNNHSTPLADLAQLPEGWNSFRATGLNDHGVAIATARNPGGQWRALALLPVEVVVRKKTDADTPPNGLCVKKATVITFDFNGSAPASSFPLAPSTVTWQIRQIKRDGTFTPWAAVPDNGCELDYNTPTAGIFQAKAIVTPPGGAAQEYQFKRRRDVPNAANSTGDVQELHKKDAPDYFGVVDGDWQISVRDRGVANLGSTYYNQNDSCVIYEGESADFGLPKCNIFVYHKCTDAGATVPLVRQNGFGFGDPDLPPNAIDWWNDNSGRTDDVGRAIVTLPIPGWTSVPDADLPQPGWVVARPRLGEAP